MDVYRHVHAHTYVCISIYIYIQYIRVCIDISLCIFHVHLVSLAVFCKALVGIYEPSLAAGTELAAQLAVILLLKSSQNCSGLRKSCCNCWLRWLAAERSMETLQLSAKLRFENGAKFA